ncbi:hypothetical protein KOXY103107_16785 [Komagataeibacter xylinus]|nr:hypothetical protein [Komagataeibacter xylinus]
MESDRRAEHVLIDVLEQIVPNVGPQRHGALEALDPQFPKYFAMQCVDIKQGRVTPAIEITEHGIVMTQDQPGIVLVFEHRSPLFFGIERHWQPF